jgi:mRNA interferase MazF
MVFFSKRISLTSIPDSQVLGDCSFPKKNEDRSGTVIAIALSSQPQKAGFPLTMPIESAALPKKSWVKISRIRTLSTERIGSRIGRLSAEELIRVIEGLNEIIGT